jgi:hypothetical protein
MAFDPIKLRVLAEKKEDENWDFRTFIKAHCDLDEAELDNRVSAITKRVWAGIDCTTCANCCKEVKPTFSEEDVARLSGRLGVARQEFIDAHLQKTKPGQENPWTTCTLPCPFLKENKCSVYEDRPADCRNYPYLYESDLVFRMMSMIGRTFTCPIVYEVMEELKPSVGFSRRKRRP